MKRKSRYRCNMCKYSTKRVVESPDECPRCKRDNTMEGHNPDIAFIATTLGGS